MYAILLLVSTTALRFVMFFDLDGRTLFAAYAPMLIGLGAMIDRYTTTLGEAETRVNATRLTVTAAAAALWVLVVVALGIRTSALFRPDGSGAMSVQLEGARRELSRPEPWAATTGCSVSSNSPQVVWLTGHEVAQFPPPLVVASSTCVIVVAGVNKPVEAADLAGYRLVFKGDQISIYRS